MRPKGLKMESMPNPDHPPRVELHLHLEGAIPLPALWELIRKYDAVAADWESAAIAWVAKRNGQRLLILRGVSDLVNRSGGEAYGNYELFIARTREIMEQLLAALPRWLASIRMPDTSATAI